MAGIVSSVISDQMKKDWSAFWGSGAGSTYNFGSSAVKGTNNGDGTATLKWNDGRTSTVKQSEGIDGIAGRDNTLAQEWGYTYGYDKGKDFSAPTAVTANAAGYLATERAVQSTDLTSHHLNRILSEGSPLLEQAAGKAMQMSGARGLVNSSMAAQAGTEAMISQALPVASQDANTYFTQGRANQDADNSAKAFNANAENQIGMFNANAKNTANLAGFNANVGMARDQAQNRFTASQNQLNQDYTAAQADKDRAYNADQKALDRNFTLNQANLDRIERQRQYDVSMRMAQDQLNTQKFNTYSELYFRILDGTDSEAIKQSKFQHLQALYFGSATAPSPGTAANLTNSLPPATLPGAGVITRTPQGPTQDAPATGQTPLPTALFAPAEYNSPTPPQHGQVITLGGMTGTYVQGANGQGYLQLPNGDLYAVEQQGAPIEVGNVPNDREPGGRSGGRGSPYPDIDMGIGNIWRGPEQNLPDRGRL